MAVVYEEPKKVEVEKHSAFYETGARIERYLLGNGARSKGMWLERHNASEKKMHTIAMLRFYRLVKLLTAKEFDYSRLINGEQKIRRCQHNPSVHWYCHNVSATFQLEIDTEEETFRLRSAEPQGVSIHLPILENRPKTNDDNTSITILDEDGKPIHAITLNPEIFKGLHRFADWVREVCADPSEEIVNDPEKLKTYDQMIWNEIFHALGLTQYCIGASL